MSPRDVVLLDIDGTLVDSTYHHALAWHRAAHRHEVGVPLVRMHRAIGMGGDRLVGHVLGEEVEERLGDELREAWREEYQRLVDEVPPLPGAVDLVRRQAAEGRLVALASSGDPAFSAAAVDLLGIGEDVAVLATAEDADSSKPEPDILAATLDRLAEEGHDIGRAVLVGDTPYDVDAAGRLGLRCLAVLTGGFGREELESAGAATVLDDLTAAVDLDWEDLLRPPRR